MKKYYEILELDMSASIDEVEQAYKELSKVWRPQTYQNLPRYRRKAEIKSKEINEAYERVRTFLLAKPPAEDQENHVPGGQYFPETIREKLAPEETIQPQISKPPRLSDGCHRGRKADSCYIFTAGFNGSSAKRI
jgi:curved DNA-binding protein CbpA